MIAAKLLIVLAIMAAAPVIAGERLVGRARVTDGDTLRVGGVAVRLKGLAAPEAAHFGEPGEPGGIEAKAFMVELVEGETVVCDLTQERTHGRRVGWCYHRRQGHRRGADQGRAGAGLPWVLGWTLRGRRARSSARAAVCRSTVCQVGSWIAVAARVTLVVERGSIAPWMRPSGTLRRHHRHSLSDWP